MLFLCERQSFPLIKYFPLALMMEHKETELLRVESTLRKMDLWLWNKMKEWRGEKKKKTLGEILNEFFCSHVRICKPALDLTGYLIHCNWSESQMETDQVTDPRCFLTWKWQHLSLDSWAWCRDSAAVFWLQYIRYVPWTMAFLRH